MNVSLVNVKELQQMYGFIVGSKQGHSLFVSSLLNCHDKSEGQELHSPRVHRFNIQYCQKFQQQELSPARFSEDMACGKPTKVPPIGQEILAHSHVQPKASSQG